MAFGQISNELVEWKREMNCENSEGCGFPFCECNRTIKAGVAGMIEVPVNCASTNREDDFCNGELGAHPLCSTDYCPCWENEIQTS